MGGATRRPLAMIALAMARFKSRGYAAAARVRKLPSGSLPTSGAWGLHPVCVRPCLSIQDCHTDGWQQRPPRELRSAPKYAMRVGLVEAAPWTH